MGRALPGGGVSPPPACPSAGYVELPAPPGYRLEECAPSYGFFMTAPSLWNPGEFSLSRPFTLAPGRVVRATVSHPPGASLCVRCEPRGEGEELVVRQVERMLRLSPGQRGAVDRLHALVPRAQSEGFGWLFRSPTLWEDVVKSVLLCNCGFSRTISMSRLVCEQIGTGGGFPAPEEVVAAGEEALRGCGLGYRASRVLQLAGVFCGAGAGALARALENPAATEEELTAALLALPGVGPFVANNIKMLLGRFRDIPADTETARHLRQVRGVPSSAILKGGVGPAAAREYAPYDPVQFLVYWHELWRGYEAAFGAVKDMQPEDYALCTGARMTKATREGRQLRAGAAGGGGAEEEAAAVLKLVDGEAGGPSRRPRRKERRAPSSVPRGAGPGRRGAGQGGVVQAAAGWGIEQEEAAVLKLVDDAVPGEAGGPSGRPRRGKRRRGPSPAVGGLAATAAPAAGTPAAAAAGRVARPLQRGWSRKGEGAWRGKRRAKGDASSPDLAAI